MIAHSLMHAGCSIRLTFAKEESDMKDLLERTIKAMGISGNTPENIYHMLRNEGLTPGEATLTYKGAKIIMAEKERAAKARRP